MTRSLDCISVHLVSTTEVMIVDEPSIVNNLYEGHIDYLMLLETIGPQGRPGRKGLRCPRGPRGCKGKPGHQGRSDLVLI